MTATSETLEYLLPQTQCRQCGFDGCAKYAEAIARKKAPINRCAPGGKKTIARLAKALGVIPIALDPEYGREMPLALARIDPNLCIGCRICADICPVSAVTGMPKNLFAVIESACTGCALCVPACPMDCIELFEPGRPWTDEDAERARLAHKAAVERKAREKAQLQENARKAVLTKKDLIAEALARARANTEKK